MNDKLLLRRQQRNAIFVIAIPMILNGIMQQSQIMINRVFLGYYNSDYFAALGNAIAPFSLCMAALWTIPIGTTVLISQYIGAQQTDSAKDIAESSLKFNLLLSIFFFLICFCFSDFFFRIMGVKEPVLTYCNQYLRILSFSLITMGPAFTAGAILQANSITKPIMYIGFIRSGLNIILDALLIFGYFGFPEMGLKGAALASIIANMLCDPVIILITFFSTRLNFKIRVKSLLAAKWQTYMKVIRISLPSTFEEILWNFGNTTLLAYLNTISVIGAGIFTLVLGIELIPILIYLGVANACTVLIGMKTGAGDTQGAVKTGFLCLKYTMIICAIIGVFFFLIPGPLLALFTNDSALVSASIPFLVMCGLILFPKAVNVLIGSGIKGFGDTRWMLTTQIFGTIFIIISGYLLSFSFKMNMYGVYIAILLDEIVRAVLNVLRFRKGKDFQLKIGRWIIYKSVYPLNQEG